MRCIHFCMTMASRTDMTRVVDGPGCTPCGPSCRYFAGTATAFCICSWMLSRSFGVGVSGGCAITASRYGTGAVLIPGAALTWVRQRQPVLAADCHPIGCQLDPGAAAVAPEAEPAGPSLHAFSLPPRPRPGARC